MTRVFLKDPRVDHRGAYDALTSVGVDATSTMDEILEASFRLMEDGDMTPRARAALAELRDPRRRALIDFFLHSLEKLRSHPFVILPSQKEDRDFRFFSIE